MRHKPLIPYLKGKYCWMGPFYFGEYICETICFFPWVYFEDIENGIVYWWRLYWTYQEYKSLFFGILLITWIMKYVHILFNVLRVQSFLYMILCWISWRNTIFCLSVETYICCSTLSNFRAFFQVQKVNAFFPVALLYWYFKIIFVKTFCFICKEINAWVHVAIFVCHIIIQTLQIAHTLIVWPVGLFCVYIC